MQEFYHCPSKSDIGLFQDMVKDRPHLYLCSVANGSALFEDDVTYVGSANPLAPIGKQLEYLVQCSRSYWKGHKSDKPVLEVLAPVGSVQITASADW